MSRLAMSMIMVVVCFAGVATNPAVAAPPQDIGACHTIDKPGPYVLARDLHATDDCLLVTTSFVTIDLAGFTITGSGAGAGVRTSFEGVSSVTVRNGTITQFANGIDFFGRGYVVERIRAVNNTRNGIQITSPTGAPGDSIVKDSNASMNGNNGILLQNGEEFQGLSGLGGFSAIGNIANSNVVGIHTACPGVVLHNTATRNGVDFLDTGLLGCTHLGNSTPP